MDSLRAFLLAGDDERRAIERELHDGVLQQLVAFTVDLQLARNLVAADPQAAIRLLDDIRAGVGLALDELRDLAARVHPPLLDTQGLLAALRMAAAAAPFPTGVEGTVGGVVPPEVAVSVHRCWMATLAAVDGEKPSATIVVTGDGVLEFEIALAGGRVDVGALEPLSGRFAALGGALQIAPDRLTGRLPLPS